MLTLSDQALAHIRAILSQTPGAVGLRLGVEQKGCSGLSYIIAPAMVINAEDHIITQGDLKILIDARSLPELSGTALDYVSDQWGGSLQLQNPNVKSQCGCGESFNTEK